MLAIAACMVGDLAVLVLRKKTRNLSQPPRRRLPNVEGVGRQVDRPNKVGFPAEEIHGWCNSKDAAIREYLGQPTSLGRSACRRMRSSGKAPPW